MYKCRHFALHELFPPEMMGLSETTLWGLINMRILMAADLLRDQFGPIQINTWKSGGEFMLRGMRPHDCKEGAEFSRHKLGGALDLFFTMTSAEQVRQFLRTQPDQFRGLINRVEEGLIQGTKSYRTWVHIDDGNSGRLEYIYFFRP